jgi:hypothetical protein
MANELLTKKGMKEIVAELKFAVEKSTSRMTDEIQSTFSDEMNAVVDLGKGAFEKVTSFGQLLFQSLFKKKAVDKSIIHQGKVLDDMLKLQKKQARGQAFGIEKKNSWLDILMAPLIIGASVLGGLIRKIIAPFEVLWKMFKVVGAGSLLKMVPGVTRFLGFITSIWKAFEDIPFLGRIAKGLSWGFKRLFIPLQMILSTIDFIEGWRKSQGDWFEKIKAGITNVITKFFDLPFKIMAETWSWLDRTFFGGKKSAEERVGEINAAIKRSVDFVFDFGKFLFNSIVDLTQKAVGWAKDNLSLKAIGEKIDFFKTLYSDLIESVKGIWNQVIEKTKALFDMFFDIPRKFGEFIDEQRNDFQAWWKNTWLGRKTNALNTQDMKEQGKHPMFARSNEDYLKRLQDQQKDDQDKSEGLLENIESVLKKLLFVNEEQLRSADKSIQLQSVVVNNDNSRPVLNSPPVRGPSEMINALNYSGGYR